MAYAHQTRVAHSAFGEWLRNIVDVTRDALQRRRIYRQTINELSALTARDLADLGIDRSMIRWLAHEAAYGE